MAELLVFDKNQYEKVQLVLKIRKAVAVCSEDFLNIRDFEKEQEVEEYLESEEAVDMALMEISSQADIGLSEKLRLEREMSEMLLVADSSISPMEYLTPQIRASSLLLRPFSEAQSRQVIKDFVSAYYRAQQESGEEKSLLIENREGRIVIPFSQIYYLEVREKRVFIRLRNKEYSQYDTLDNVLKSLPDYFMRCHRSYVFNTKYLDRVRLSDNTIYLEHGITVPLSRSYKADIKEYLNGLHSL